MSDFAAVALMFAVGVFNLFFYWHANRWMHSVSDAVVTGVIRGALVTVRYRRFLLYTSWIFAVTGGISAQFVTSFFWYVIGGLVEVDELKLCAYMACYLNSVAVLAWLVIAPFWYRELAYTLRQAEAD